MIKVGTPNSISNFDTLDDWIYEWEIRVLSRQDTIKEIESSEEYKLEEKFLQQQKFNSKHKLKEEEEKQLAWDKQLLGFLTELKSAREHYAHNKSGGLL